MKEAQQKLREFMTKFEQPYANKPFIPDDKTRWLAYKLIDEEIKETLAAIENIEDYAFPLTEVADGITDSIYVLLWTANTFGIEIEPIFNEVHRSNMSKVWPDGTVHKNEFGKVVKPYTYSPARIREIIKEQQEA